MKVVKITVAKKTLHEDLAEAHGGTRGIAACEAFEVGQSFFTNWGRPDNFCEWAWNDINKVVVALLTGGTFHAGPFDGWMGREGTMVASCTDGFRPVSFLLERADAADLVDTAGVPDPAPRAVYASERWGEFSYEFAGLGAGAPLRARLHFAETAFAAAGKRAFHVDANGARVVDGLDVFAAAGGAFKGFVVELGLRADAAGKLRLDFAKGGADFPKASGIEILGASGQRLAAVNCGGPAVGAFGADAGFAGGNAAG